MRSRRKWIKIVVGGLLLYVMSFLVVQHAVVASYEDWHPAERHWLRPAYDPFFYPLRWLNANGWSPLPTRLRKRAGTVVKISPTLLILDSGRGYADYMGFVCEPSVCAQLDGVVKGAKIEATFGATLVGGQDRLVSKLLQIRVGEPEDRDSDFEPAPCMGIAWVAALSLLPNKERAPWPSTGVFAGYYRFGFEISDFRPAGTKERWWLSEAKSEVVSRCYGGCYLVVRGQLSGLGPHGHLSAYKRELKVIEVLEQRSVKPDENVAF